MFGSKRKKAVREISNNVRPVLALFQRHYGLPQHFWHHEYVLGFFAALIGNHAKMATGGKITGQDYDLALIEGWEIVSGQNGQHLWKKNADLMISEDATYFEGFDRGLLIFLLSINRLNAEAKSFEIVKSALQSSNGDPQKASTILLMDTFTEMDERLKSY